MSKVDIRVSIARPVFAGDKMMFHASMSPLNERTPADGYVLLDVPYDGIYISPNHPVIPYDEAVFILADIQKVRKAEERKRIRDAAKKKRALAKAASNVLVFPKPALAAKAKV